jgi:hypothetical protein
MVIKKIFITHASLDCLEQSKQAWKRLNPDWEVFLYDNTMCKEFLLKEYGTLYSEIFEWIPDGPIKSDFWRVCVVYKYGGLYVDADIEPLIPLNEYLDSKISFATCISYLKGYNPHFLYANPNEPILKDCIDTYLKFFRDKKVYAYWDWSITGILKIPYFMKKQSGVYIWNGQKIQLLKEEVGTGRYDMHCTYKGKRVLNNRVKNYDEGNHCFI